MILARSVRQHLARMAPPPPHSATNRLAMVSSHLSTSQQKTKPPGPVTGLPPHAASDEADPVVYFESIHAMRKVILNRPKVLNAITSEITDRMQPQLESWEQSDRANLILFKGNGKSFCAGGDVATLVKQLDSKGEHWHKSSAFFEREYKLDAFIAQMQKPIISLMHGHTLGGGVGLSVHAAFRIATETTSIGMPETKIGLFPDVGANFFLSRLDGQLGMYLGLTSENIKGAGALFSGFATHYVPADNLESLEHALSELPEGSNHDTINNVIEEYVADMNQLKTSAAGYDLIGTKRLAIDRIFSASAVEDIISGLEDLAKGDISKMGNHFQAASAEDPNGLPALQDWAKRIKDTILERSPTSVKVAFSAIREGKTLNIQEAFEMDMRTAVACCNPEVAPDFKIGVTHLLIDKIKGKRPDWSPSTLEEVSMEHIQKIFFSNPPPFSNPPLPELFSATSGRKSKKPYTQYPYARYALPTESNIMDVVTGAKKGSGEYALKAEEIVEIMVSDWDGKIGVAEKVQEVLMRCCKVDIDSRTLRWIG